MKGSTQMNYIITGSYANGDQYGEKADNIAELAYIISDINRFDTDSTKPEQRIIANSVKVETEDDE